MEENLLEAKIAVAKASVSSSNSEKVLAEIIALSKINKAVYPGQIMDVVPSKLNMTPTICRGVIHSLRKSGLIQKVGLCYFTNPKYVQL